MTWKQLLWIVVIPSFLGHHWAAMRELWQQSKPCLGHRARARHDGTGGACVKTCWNRLRQVTHGFWTTVKQSLFCGATGLEVGWAELNSLYQVPILQVVGAFEAGNDLNQSQWRNGAPLFEISRQGKAQGFYLDMLMGTNEKKHAPHVSASVDDWS